MMMLSVKEYGGKHYIQHHSRTLDDWKGFVSIVNDFVSDNPNLKVDIDIAISQDDLIVGHVHSKPNEKSLGIAAINIFHLTEGKIIE